MKETRPVVISMYDRTGNMVRDWAEAGCDCYCIDFQHSIRRERIEEVGKGLIHFVWGDARTWGPKKSVQRRAIILFGFPPCTHVCVSDAMDFMTKGTGLLRDSLEMFSICEHAAMWSGLPYMIENPVGKFSDHMRKPNHIFQPWHYGDLHLKKTCLWTGNGFTFPRKIHWKPPEGTTDKLHKWHPSRERANIRSETPKLFAKAVFEANKHLIP